MSTKNSQNTQSATISAEDARLDEFNRTIASLEIPKNVDAVLLDAWLRREKKAFLQKNFDVESSSAQSKASLPLTYGGYLSMTVMIMVILLGLLSGTMPDEILRKAFLAMICFFGIGYLIGWILDNSVRESAREMVLEVVKRSEMNENSTNENPEPGLAKGASAPPEQPAPDGR